MEESVFLGKMFSPVIPPLSKLSKLNLFFLMPSLTGDQSQVYLEVRWDRLLLMRNVFSNTVHSKGVWNVMKIYSDALTQSVILTILLYILERNGTFTSLTSSKMYAK